MSSVPEFNKICFHCNRIILAKKNEETRDCNSHYHIDCEKNAYICQRLALRIIGGSNITKISDKSIAHTNTSLIFINESLTDKAILIEKQKTIKCICGKILTGSNIKSSNGGLSFDTCLIM